MKIAAASAVVGVAMGLAGVWGLTGAGEAVTWLAVMLGMAALISGASRKPFLAGLGSGMVMSVAAAVMHAVFVSTYLANQPAFAQSIEHGELSMDERLFFLLTSIPIGLASGVVLGLLSYAAARMRSRRGLQTVRSEG